MKLLVVLVCFTVLVSFASTQVPLNYAKEVTNIGGWRIKHRTDDVWPRSEDPSEVNGNEYIFEANSHWVSDWGSNRASILIHDQPLSTAIRKDRDYQFKFELLHNDGGSGYTLKNVRVFILAYSAGAISPTSEVLLPVHQSLNNILFDEFVNGPFDAPLTEYTKLKVNIRRKHLLLQPDVFIRSRILIKLTWSAPVPNYVFPIQVQIRRAKLVQFAGTHSVPHALYLTPSTDTVTIPVMSQTPDPNFSDCPYNAPNLARWEDPATWGGSVPSGGSSVSLPENTDVLLSSSPTTSNNPFYRIHIPSTSSLIFDDTRIILHVENIYVEGRFLLGSEDCPLLSDIKIIFFGERTTEDRIAAGMGSKGLGATPGSTVHMFGKRMFPTWTRLAAPALVGDDRVYLQQAPVNWEPGMRVVLATSWYRDNYDDQNEVRTIAAIEGRMVQFTQQLKFNHAANAEWQVEVGLLTRNIIVQGHHTSRASEFGGHMLLRGETKISGVRGFLMGQKNMLARYPFHFHLANTRPQNYFSDNSVEESFYRCYVIHRTWSATVERNVAFNVQGHCYYIAEDGVETDNTVQYNLAVKIHPIGTPPASATQFGPIIVQSDEVDQPADTAAAGFYLTNKQNRIIGNAASGGYSGFAMPFLPRPILTSQNDASRSCYVPMDATTIEFRGNSAHSSGYYWMTREGSCMYHGGTLTHRESDNLLEYNNGRTFGLIGPTDPPLLPSWVEGCEDSPPIEDAENVFEHTKVFLCNHAFTNWEGRARMKHFAASNSVRYGTFFNTIIQRAEVTDDLTLHPDLMNMALDTVGPTGIVDDWNLWQSAPILRDGFQCYDQASELGFQDIIVKNVKQWEEEHPFIANSFGRFFRRNKKTVFTQLSGKSEGICAIARVTFKNVDENTIWGDSWQSGFDDRDRNGVLENMWDIDGSFSKTGVSSFVATEHPFWNDNPSCTLLPNYGWTCPKTEGMEIGFIYTQDTLNGVDWQMAYFGRPDTWMRTPLGEEHAIVGYTGRGIYYYRETGMPSTFSLRPFKIPYGTYMILALSFPAGTTFTIAANGHTYTAESSIMNVVNGNGLTYYWNDEHLYLKLYDFGATRPRLLREYGDLLFHQIHWASTTINFNVNCPADNCDIGEPNLPEAIPNLPTTNVISIGTQPWTDYMSDPCCATGDPTSLPEPSTTPIPVSRNSEITKNCVTGSSCQMTLRLKFQGTPAIEGTVDLELISNGRRFEELRMSGGVGWSNFATRTFKRRLFVNAEKVKMESVDSVLYQEEFNGFFTSGKCAGKMSFFEIKVKGQNSKLNMKVRIKGTCRLNGAADVLPFDEISTTIKMSV